MKLAYADREIYYGDPKFSRVPMQHLLSDGYNAARRGLISERASYDLRPGAVPGFEDQMKRGMAVIDAAGTSATGISEPTLAHLSEKPSVERSGDTVHLDIIARWGNMRSDERRVGKECVSTYRSRW